MTFGLRPHQTKTAPTLRRDKRLASFSWLPRARSGFEKRSRRWKSKTCPECEGLSPPGRSIKNLPSACMARLMPTLQSGDSAKSCCKFGGFSALLWVQAERTGRSALSPCYARIKFDAVSMVKVQAVQNVQAVQPLPSPVHGNGENSNIAIRNNAKF